MNIFHSHFPENRLIRTLLARCAFVLGIGALITTTSNAQTVTQAARSPQVERPIAFDTAGRILVLTPSLAARWKLSAPDWPLGSDWNEARLFRTDSASGAAVLVVQRVDGAVARYVYASEDVLRLRALVDAAVIAAGLDRSGTRVGTTLELSEPAGNAFVRNQTWLGLIAYGPATAAILSDNGAAAGGGYLLAAGTSFFIAARTVRDRSVTRAQTILAFHGGTRGAGMGAVVAAIAGADGGPGYGLPILAGALGGTVAGFRGAKGLSDGEAASSGYAADLAALTTIGLTGAAGVFENDTLGSGDRRASTKIALGSAIGTAIGGYLIGPRYARRSAYNVTAGDIDVAFTSAVIGAVAVNGILGSSANNKTRFGVTTGGLLLGAVIADRTKVRHADRTSADGTLVQLGAVAGALMGGGIALMAEFETQATLAVVAAGGAAGLALADVLVRPTADAGPKRGVLPSGSNAFNSAPFGSRDGPRLSISLVPAATSIALGMKRSPTVRVPLTARVQTTKIPVVRLAF